MNGKDAFVSTTNFDLQTKVSMTYEKTRWRSGRLQENKPLGMMYISGGLPPARRGPAAKLWGVPEEIYSSGGRVSNIEKSSFSGEATVESTELK